MAALSRLVVVALVATALLAALWLVALRPEPVAVNRTPLAPTQAIPKADQASAVSDAANARLQQALDEAGQP